MSDSSSFREVAEQVTSESEEVAVETPAAPAVESVEQAEAPQEETFAEPVDPKSLEEMTPQQLLEIKKNWERAYTQKRQKEAEELKQYKQRIAELEQSKSAPQEQIEAKAEDARREVELGRMSVQEYTQYIQDLMVEKAREVARQEYESISSEKEEQQYQEKALESFNNADSRLNPASPEYNESFREEVQREVADLLDEHLEQYGTHKGFDAQAVTKEVVDRRDRQLDELIKKRTQESMQAAKMRDAKERKAQVRGTTSPSQSIHGESIRDVLSETIDSAA